MRPVVVVPVLLIFAACTSVDGLSEGNTTKQALVRCLIDPCTTDAPECCGEGPDGSVYLRFACGKAGTCSDKGLVLPCRSSADCAAAGSPAGSVCCEFRSSSLTTSVQCTARSSCLAERSNRLLCDHRTPECEAPEVCSDDGSGYLSLETCHPPK